MEEQQPAQKGVLDQQQVNRRLQQELPAWRLEDGAISRTYRTSGWKATLMVVNAIGHLAEAAFHHPELAVSYAAVVIRLKTHSENAVTGKDFELAGMIEQVLMWQPGKAGGALEGVPDDPRFSYITYQE